MDIGRITFGTACAMCYGSGITVAGQVCSCGNGIPAHRNFTNDQIEVHRLQAENAALKAELKAINAALDDPRTDLTMTACQVIAALKEQVAQLKTVPMKYRRMEFNAQLQEENAKLKEQVAQLQATPADKREDLRCVISDICAQARELQETIAQQAEALRVKDEALSLAVTNKRIKHLMESYYPRKLMEGNISREVFSRHIFELREMLGRLGANTEELSVDVERVAKAVPLDAAMCAKHGITHSTTMLEMKKKFPSIYVEEF